MRLFVVVVVVVATACCCYCCCLFYAVVVCCCCYCLLCVSASNTQVRIASGGSLRISSLSFSTTFSRNHSLNDHTTTRTTNHSDAPLHSLHSLPSREQRCSTKIFNIIRTISNTAIVSCVCVCVCVSVVFYLRVLRSLGGCCWWG